MLILPESCLFPAIQLPSKLRKTLGEQGVGESRDVSLATGLTVSVRSAPTVQSLCNIF